MDRRSFLKNWAAITAASTLPLAVAASPTPTVLWGDGIHDDTDALQAWVDGGQVVGPDGRALGDALMGNSFLISKTLDGSKAVNKKIFGCYFYGRPFRP